MQIIGLKGPITAFHVSVKITHKQTACILIFTIANTFMAHLKTISSESCKDSGKTPGSPFFDMPETHLSGRYGLFIFHAFICFSYA